MWGSERPPSKGWRSKFNASCSRDDLGSVHVNGAFDTVLEDIARLSSGIMICRKTMQTDLKTGSYNKYGRVLAVQCDYWPFLAVLASMPAPWGGLSLNAAPKTGANAA